MASFNESLNAIPTRKFLAGEFIIHQDKKSNGIFFLKRGSVSVIMDGQKITEIDQLGSIFGEMAYFMDNLSSASIQCSVDSEFLHIEDPDQFLSDNPDVIVNITRKMCSRIINLSKQIAMLRTGAKAQEEMLRKVLIQNAPDDDSEIVIY